MSTFEHSIVASYDTHSKAETAIRRLGLQGIDLRRLVIVGKDFRTEQHALGLVTVGDNVRRQTVRAASFGALWGLLFGGGFLVMPAVGPLNVTGPLLVWVFGALAGAILGAAVGALGGLLTSRLESERPVKFAAELQQGTFLVIVKGSEQLLNQARTMVGEWGAARPEARVPVQLQRDALITRQSVLALLDDQEVARVSTAEGAQQLREGDEYLDLEHLDLGVQHTPRAPGTLGGLLPRRAVTDRTWLAVLEHLKKDRPSLVATR